MPVNIPRSGPRFVDPTLNSTPVEAPVVMRGYDELPPAMRVPHAARGPQPVGVQVALGDSGLFVSGQGHLVSGPGQDEPRSLAELGDTLVRAAQWVNEGGHPFKGAALPTAQKMALATSLVGAFNRANAELLVQAGFEKPEQALQMRASAAPLLLELALSFDPADRAQLPLRDQTVGLYLKLVEGETHALNRNFMIYDLERSKVALPAAVRPVVDALMGEVGQLSPPYSEWFAQGNETLSVDYHVGDGFWETEVEFYEQAGFEKRANPDGTVTMTRTFEEQKGRGADAEVIRTKVELHMRSGKTDIFKKMRDPKTHVVVYSGHASYGRNVVGALKAGTPHIGAKAFFGLHCGGGKGVHNSLRAQYPDLHVVQSKNSSYEHQDRTTLLNALKGFARRADWNDISKENRRTNSDNYYYPTDTLFRKTAEDLDGDGTIDLWDRVVSYNTFRPKADVREQLTAKDPGRPIAELDGRAFSGAVQRFVRIAGYNQWAQPLENHGILARGYFDGKLDDPIFKRADLGDGRVQLQLNKHFAHASEETLGAVMHYQLGRDATRAAGQNEVNAKLSGLLMAAKCLNVDDGALDREIWSELIAREGLPPGISLADVFATSKEDDHMLAGSQQTVESLARKLEARGVRL